MGVLLDAPGACQPFLSLFWCLSPGTLSSATPSSPSPVRGDPVQAFRAVSCFRTFFRSLRIPLHCASIPKCRSTPDAPAGVRPPSLTNSLQHRALRDLAVQNASGWLLSDYALVRNHFFLLATVKVEPESTAGPTAFSVLHPVVPRGLLSRPSSNANNERTRSKPTSASLLSPHSLCMPGLWSSSSLGADGVVSCLRTSTRAVPFTFKALPISLTLNPPCCRKKSDW